MDSNSFRNALGQFPTGVVVATARTAAGRHIGMTMNWFDSVSLDPPLILFGVLRQAHSFAVWQGIDRYANNVLDEEQKQASNQFARSKGDNWEDISPLTGDTGVPECGGCLRTQNSRAI
jgi:flavin reductase (DIM6/NTAB) family NADH-FMN oxidoreductase RutF